MRLSVVVAAYNEVRTIAEIIRRVRAVPLDIELVVVDDGSTDGTSELLRGLSGPGQPVDRLIRHERNQGKGAAIRTGLGAATGEVLVVQDADLEYDPQDFVPMMAKIEAGAQVVYGSRILGHNEMSHLSFYLGGRLLSVLTNVLYGSHITDEPTCYKMFRREALDGIQLVCTGFEFCPEVTAKVLRKGLPIEEIPIHYSPRKLHEGKKIRWRDGVTAIWTLVRYRF